MTAKRICQFCGETANHALRFEILLGNGTMLVCLAYICASHIAQMNTYPPTDTNLTIVPLFDLSGGPKS